MQINENKEWVEKIVANVVSDLRASGAIQEHTGESTRSVQSGSTFGDAMARVAKMIDQTLLKPETSAEKIKALCAGAAKYRFASVCVNSGYVKLCSELLRGTSVNVCVVTGFPLGASLPEVKAYEAERAIRDGASEVDMVMNIGAVKGGDLALAARDMLAVVRASHAREALVKVIIETELLTREEKVTACLLAKETGADFVKTCTGFAGGGATAEDIRLMRATVGPEMGVKASGGVRSLAKLEEMEAAGANRMGVTVGEKIMEELRAGG